MYRKVLVPLDGSQYAQCSLDHVRAIGLGCRVPEIILYRVVETTVPAADKTARPDRAEKQAAAEASDYVNSLTKRLKDEGLQVRGEIGQGKPDEAIIDYARKNLVDLIIMSTHGRSGVSHWEIGSVARGVVNNATMPVLLVLTAGCRVAQG